MIRLDGTTKIIQCIATGAAAGIVSGLSVSAAAATGFSEEVALTASTQTLSAAPASGVVKQVDHLSVYDTSGVANTITIQLYNSTGPVTSKQVKVTLAANECLEYTHAAGWRTLDANGNVKTTVSSTGGAFTVNGALTTTGDVSLANGKLTINASTGAAVFAGAVSGITTLAATDTMTITKPNSVGVGLAIDAGATNNTGASLKLIGRSNGAGIRRTWYMQTDQSVAGDLWIQTSSTENGAAATGIAQFTSAGLAVTGALSSTTTLSGSNLTLTNPGVGIQFQSIDVGFFADATYLYLGKYSNAAGIRVLAASGNVRVTSLAGSGSRAVNADANGELSAASDSSLKSLVDTPLPGLAEVLQLQPRAYRWKKDIADRGIDAAVEVGFFADEVAPIIPSAAPKCTDGLYGFYDRSVTAAITRAIQELAARLDKAGL